MKRIAPFLALAFLLAGCTNQPAATTSDLPISEPTSEATSEESSAEISSIQTSVESSEEITSEIVSNISSEDVTSEATSEATSELSSYQTSEAVSSAETSLDPHSLYGGYYASLESWENGEDLVNQLHAIIHGGTYNPVEYIHNSTANWDSNKDADTSLDDLEMLDVVYSGKKIDKNLTNASWQREHAFCASLMTGSTTGNAVKTLGRATDFHNLFASFTSGNTSRGNKNFGMADKTDPTYQSKLDSNGDGYSFDSVNFEPSDKDKGRLSRALFYMATMYNEVEYDPYNNVTMQPLQIVEENVPYVAGDECAFAIGNLSTLLSWTDYPVDELEYQHNESVYSYVPSVHEVNVEENHAQGNRNPYVDFPGLVDYAFGSKKDEAGSLDDVVSSYEFLDKKEEGVERYAISQAKRKYAVGDVFAQEDIQVVSIGYDGSKAPFEGFTVDGKAFGDAFESVGNLDITIQTPINDISYSLEVISEDPLALAQYQHKVTAKSEGNDFYGIASSNDTENRVTLSGVEWDVYWKSGSVQSNSQYFGCKFGTNTAPVQTLRFTSATAFSYQSLDQIKGIYLSGATASGSSYNVKMWIGDEQIYSGKLNYIDQSTKDECYGKTSPAKQGKVKIEITNITKAVYVDTIAVILED